TRTKFGFQIPNNFQEAVALDKANGNTKFQDATKVEMDQIKEYSVFRDHGLAEFDANKKLLNAPKGYQRARVHLIYDVKHDGRHKSRLVLDGHLTQIPVETVYSSVVSLKSLRLVAFLAELNELTLWGAVVGNAYLEAKTKERLFIIAGAEFGPEMEGHIFIVHKALYGSRSGGR
ncbi:MAG: hypothetical protein GY768_32200, partial [Planctomycetaceae bacterium]|nr:hypothetical protein [Planctomycetaceae bacterium]